MSPTTERPSPLAGLGILVTRPAAQAMGLRRLIEQNGGRALLFPTLEIVARNDREGFRRIVEGDSLRAFQWGIFVSGNAVACALAGLTLPPTLRLAAIGKATASALLAAGYRVDLCPKRFDSEGLLMEPAMQQVRGQNILIFRGIGGKETLAKGLRERGARVEVAECYERKLADSAPQLLVDWLARNQLHAITLTSTAVLENLLLLTPADHLARLTSLPVVVISAELGERLRDLGFTGPVAVAPQASDAGLLLALHELPKAVQ